MTYQVLKKVSKKPIQKPAVTITKDSIRFNKAACAEFGLSGGQDVELHQDDQDKNKLALKLVGRQTEDSNKVSAKGVVSANAWLNKNSLPQGTFELARGEDGTLEFAVAA